MIVESRVVRTTSDTVGPAADHLGVRDRWDAYCREKGLKSVIGNYKDNRFNALFQTAAEIYLHRNDFLTVIKTVTKPNVKLKAVKSDLECEELIALLQCLGIFYVKVKGPYWNLITCGEVPYFELYKHVCEIKQFLKQLETNPEIMFNSSSHWSESDPLDLTLVPHYNLLTSALFTECENAKDC